MSRRLGCICTALGVLCILAAAALAIHNRWQDRAAEETARQTLEQLAETILAEEAPGDPDGGVTVEGRRYLGFLSLPTLERELPVLLDWDMEGLKGSPARYAGSFGGGGLVIGAHNYDRHFGGLSRLRSGDAVYLTDGAGTVHRYVVERVETLALEDVAEMTDTQWDLTLFTCTYGGQSRVTVRCTAAGADGDG